MNIAVPMPDAVGTFEKRLLADLASKIQEWSRCRQELTRWEEEHLLVDNPSPEQLAAHRRRVERLLFFGQLCAIVAAHPDFGDFKTAEMVAATQEVLRNKLLMFHHPMPAQQAEQLLKEVFPEPGAGAAG